VIVADFVTITYKIKQNKQLITDSVYKYTLSQYGGINMTAALISETAYNVTQNLGGKTIKFKFTGVTTADWVVFDDPIGTCYATMPTGAQATCAYAMMDITSATVATATQTTVPYENADDATQVPETCGYVMIEDEIIYYAAGGAAASGTLTGCVRGCFGTTAAAHTGTTDEIAMLNTLIFAMTTVGLIRGFAEVIEE
jgi:hypothetical protein